MNQRSTRGSRPKSDEEYQAEIDRMTREIEAMLANVGRTSAQSRRIGENNRRRWDALEKRMSKDRESWSQDGCVERERELREGAMRELKLEQQLRNSEELRRLGPKPED